MTARIVIDRSGPGAVPVVEGTAAAVADVVRIAYAEGVEAAGRSTEPALAAADVRAAIDYCADEACIAAGAFCPGCRKESGAKGLATLDDFVRQFAAVSFEQGGFGITPGGPLPARTFASLETLAKHWQGEEIWYLARRVVRRLKKLEHPRTKKMAATPAEDPSPALILVRPQLPDNIGMIARAMANFGLEDLRLAAPRDGWPNERARAAAAGANHIVDAARAFAGLADAVGDLNWICVTTARQRGLAKPILTPEQAVAEMRERLARGQRCGIVFGPERTGLETDEVAGADAIVMAPVNPQFASLNLAQAAVLMGYEWLKQSRRGTLGRVTTYEREVHPGLNTHGSPPASKADLAGFFEHIEGELDRLGFFNPPHKRQTTVRNLRSMFSRMAATEQEVRTLRGIVVTLVEGKGPGRKTSP
ncbi:MAG: RNA methyltransferase [Hyphomicrobiaceae bacterium]